MRLSYDALEICRKKYNKGSFWDINDPAIDTDDDMSPKEGVHIFDELWKNELIDTTGGDIHISALGHHILQMLIYPEIYIRIDNKVMNSRTRIYFRNTYYLLVLENSAGSGEAIVELLPDLKYVVGAFAYAVNTDDAMSPSESSDRNKNDDNIKVYGDRLNKDRQVLSRLEITESDQVSLVNSITGWILQQLKECMGEHDESMVN